MAESPREKIVSDLRKEEERVSAAVQEAREKAKALEAELKSVQSALAALTGESKRSAKKKPVDEDTTSSSANEEAKPTAKRKKKAPQGTKGKASKPTSDDAD